MKAKEYRCKAKAYLYFFPECNGKCRKGWVLHHEDVNLKVNDYERYAEWRIEDLKPLTQTEHSRLHATLLTHNEEFIERIRERMKGNALTLGYRHSDEAKKKISEANKGNTHNLGHRLTTEQKLKYSLVQIGMLCWNNGVVNKRSPECPGEGWVRGRLKRS